MKECGIEFRCLTTGGGDSETQLQKCSMWGIAGYFVHRTAENPKLYQKMIEDNAIVAISDYVSKRNIRISIGRSINMII